MNEPTIEELHGSITDSLCKVSWMLEGLATVKEITHWKEDAISDGERLRLEWMIQPVLEAADDCLGQAMEKHWELRKILEKEDRNVRHETKQRHQGKTA